MVIDMGEFKKRKLIKREKPVEVSNFDKLENPYNLNVYFNSVDFQKTLDNMDAAFEELDNEGFVYDSD